MINLDFLSMLMVVAFGMIMMQGLGNLIQEFTAVPFRNHRA